MKDENDKNIEIADYWLKIAEKIMERWIIIDKKLKNKEKK
jgi:hypothetical protein